MLKPICFSACLMMLIATQPAWSAECERVEVVLISSSQPGPIGPLAPGDPFNIFDGPDDNAIYYSAADWIRDPFLDGLVDLNFGMNFGNAGEFPEGFDQQVKLLQEYRLVDAYAAGVNNANLHSAKIQFVVDSVLDMSLSGQTDLQAPSNMYVKVFSGDGLLTSLADAQLDYDRSDRKLPETWDITFPLLSPDGFRVSQDELDFFGGELIFEIDVTAELQTLLSSDPNYAGFSMAGSEDGDFVLLSVDGGSGSFAQLPRLVLIGPLLGDFDDSNTVDLADFAVLQPCFAGADKFPLPGCFKPDLDQDEDVDNEDVTLFTGNFFGPNDECTEIVEPAAVAGSKLAAARGPSIQTPYFFGDFNRDGELGPADRTLFMDCYAQGDENVSTTCSTTDLNADGQVNDADYALFVAIFGQ